MKRRIKQIFTPLFDQFIHKAALRINFISVKLNVMSNLPSSKSSGITIWQHGLIDYCTVQAPENFNTLTKNISHKTKNEK